MHPVTHRRSHGLVVRAFLRDAAACDVVLTGETPPAAFPMKLIAPEGVFEVFIPRRTEVCA
jgi:1,4-alpha-glucan branching enzyme